MYNREEAMRSLLLIVIVFAAGCRENVGDFGLDLAAPQIVAVSPAAGAIGVAFSEPVVVSFSELLDSATVAASITVAAESGEPLAGTVELNGLDATYTPAGSWDYLSTYRIIVSKSVRDLAGNALEADFSSDFLTRDLQWTATVAVSTTTDNSAYASGPRIDIVGNAAFIAWDSISAWVSRRSLSGTWETPLKVSDPVGGTSEDTTVAVLGSNAMVVWAQQNAGLTTIDILGRTIDESGLSAIQPIENTTAVVSSPVLGSDGDTSAVAAFAYSGTPKTIRGASFAADVGWVNPTLIQYATSDGEFPRLSMSISGNSTAVWRQVVGAETNVLASYRPSGGDFSPPVTLDVETTFPVEMGVAARGADDALVLWLQSVGGSDDLLASRYSDGIWELPPLVISTASGAFCVATNEAGEALVVFPTSGDYRSAHFRGGEVTYEPVGPAEAQRLACFLDAKGNGGYLWLDVAGGSGNMKFRRYLADSGWSEATLAESDDDGSVVEGSAKTGIAADCSGDGRAAATWFRLPAAGGTAVTVWASSFE